MHRVLAHAPSMLTYWDHQLRCQSANQAHQQWWGTHPQNWVGAALETLLGPTQFAVCEPRMRAALLGSAQTFQLTILLRDGIQRLCLVHYLPEMLDGRVIGCLAQITDVTALKHTTGELPAEANVLAEVECGSHDGMPRSHGTAQSIIPCNQTCGAPQTLAEAAHFCERLKVLMPGQVHVVDLADAGHVALLDPVLRTLGYSQEDILTTGADLAMVVVHPADRLHVRDHLHRLHNAPDDEALQVSFRARDRAGQWQGWQRREVVLSRDAHGKVRELVGTISAQVDGKPSADEAQARARADLYQATFAAAPVGIAHVSIDGRWVRFNDATCSITGCPRAKLLTMTLVDISHPDDLEAERVQMRRLLSGLTQQFAMEKRFVREDGRVV